MLVSLSVSMTWRLAGNTVSNGRLTNAAMTTLTTQGNKMKTHFASIAEAVSYMVDLGWTTVENVADGRIMEDYWGRRVKIYKRCLLDVEIAPL